MRQSSLFTKTRRQAPKDEVSKNAELLIRGGFVHKEMAGVYSFLPLGLRVLEKINSIIRREMNALGASEMFLSAIQEKTPWESTGRWSDDSMDVWFKTTLKNGTVLGLAPTHEEPLTRLMKDHIQSYRDLPRYVFQFQTKFRNETRAKSGVMRGREFLMKDLYSFSADEESHNEFYEKVCEAYKRIFDQVGLGDKTYLTRASGGSFSKYSYEFQTICDAGEDTIFVHDKLPFAINQEIIDEPGSFDDLKVGKPELEEKKAIEVGNVFSLGTRFSESLELKFLDKDGKPKLAVMGSYGIGPSRLMGAIVETSLDEKGIIWPRSVAPFAVHIIEMLGNEKTKAASEGLYGSLEKAGIEVLYDDRSVSPGEKLADADLIGVPFRVVVSDKSLSAGGFELKRRSEKDSQIMSEEQIIKAVSE